MKMVGHSIGDACPETCAGGKISGAAAVVAGASIVPVLKTTIKMTGDCDAFDVDVAAAKLADQLGVDMGQISMVKDCDAGRRRRLNDDEFTVESEVVVPEGNDGVTADRVFAAAEKAADDQDGFAVKEVGVVTGGMKVVGAPSPPPAMPPPPPSPSPPPMCASECGIFSNGARRS